ncbi:MAG: Ig-like domain-containing protein [Caldilineaceae bacterium]
MHQNNKFSFHHSAAAPAARALKSRFRTWWSVALALVLVAQSLLAAGSVSASTYTWAATFSGGNNGEGKGIAVDSSGNVFTTGHFQNTFDFDPGAGTTTATIRGQRDIFISKLDSNGAFVWVKSLGGLVIDEARAIALDSTGNIYVTGDFRGTVDFDPSGNAAGSDLTSAGDYDMFITKRDSAGEFVWSKSFGSTSLDQGYDVAVGSDLRVYTTGQFSGTVNFDPSGATTTYQLTSSGYDPYISALNSDGTVAWANFVKGPANERGQGVAVDSSNNVFLVGYYGGQNTDFNPTGTPSIPNYAGVRDIFLVKYDANGVFQWVRGIGNTGNDYASDVDVDATGNVYVTGTFVGTVDFDPGTGILELSSASPDKKDIFVAKFNNNGALQWAKKAGGPGDDEGYHIEVNSSGNVVTTGYFTDTVDFDPGAGTAELTSAGDKDIFVWALDANGDYVDAAAMGGPGEDLGYSVTTDNSGNVYTTGAFHGTADFDPTAGVDNKTSGGNADIFVSKLNFFSSTPNIAPTAVDDSASVLHDTTLNGATVLSNDSDPEDGAAVTISTTPVTNVAHGNLTINSNGTYEYQPDAGFAGSDSFVYMISDSGGLTDTATVNIDVTNTAPTATNDSFTAQTATAFNGNVKSNDSDADGDPLTVNTTPVSNVTHGSLTLNGDGTFSYTSDAGYVGPDSFTYEISDNAGATAQATATISVSATLVNNAPNAVDDTATTDEDVAHNGASVTANDTDPENNELTVETTPVSGPAHGTLQLNANGTYVYTPTADYNGPDSFVYRVCDNGVPASECAEATVSITVTPVNDPPVATDDTFVFAQNSTNNVLNVLSNDTVGPDTNETSADLSITTVSKPDKGGSASIDGATIKYTPASDFVGTEKLTYTISDGHGGESTATATITITVSGAGGGGEFYMPMVFRN